MTSALIKRAETWSCDPYDKAIIDELVAALRAAEAATAAAVEGAPLDPIWPNAVNAMLDRFDYAKGKGGYPTANEREAMRRCLAAIPTPSSGEE